MINYGTTTSHGTLLRRKFWLELRTNYGTFYNYGTIIGGTNKAICIDETSHGTPRHWLPVRSD
jgi:hypothetical protein